MISFDELMTKFDLIKGLFLTKIGHDEQDHIKNALDFTKHLYEIKCWFIRISWKNKKQFLLDLIDEVQDLSTISLLLKSIWNCRLKDSIYSISEYKTWSIYDQVPLDHNRTVLSSCLQEIMLSNRKWFRSLPSEQQSLVVAELLSVAGGPIMWEVLKYSQKIYEKNFELDLNNIKECVVVVEPPADKKIINVEVTKKEQTPRRKSSATHILESSIQPFRSGKVQQELDANLALWASTVKSIKDNLKLEELEITFKDDTKKRIWKVNRTKSEAVETVDFIQLLPSAIGKRILWHLTLTQLSECARVNKYWAYLVDELRAELTARQKIDVELEKLRENMMRRDASLHLFDKSEDMLDINSAPAKSREKLFLNKYALRFQMNKQKKRKESKPHFRNMADLNTRLDIRGAADENIRKWCGNICKMYKNCGKQEANPLNHKSFEKQETNFTFASPMLCEDVTIPLNPPLIVDPAVKFHLKLEANSRKVTSDKE